MQSCFSPRLLEDLQAGPASRRPRIRRPLLILLPIVPAVSARRAVCRRHTESAHPQGATRLRLLPVLQDRWRGADLEGPDGTICQNRAKLHNRRRGEDVR
jgi:hypothetical protein